MQRRKRNLKHTYILQFSAIVLVLLAIHYGGPFLNLYFTVMSALGLSGMDIYLLGLGILTAIAYVLGYVVNEIFLRRYQDK